MKHKVGTIIAVIALVLVISIVLLTVAVYAYGKWIFRETDTEIKDGFSPKLLNELKNKYGITIPDDAIFIKGYYPPLTRDPVMRISFECPLNNFDKDSFDKTENKEEYLAEYVRKVLSLDENRFDHGSFDDQIYGGWDDGWGECLDYSLVDRKQSYNTRISFSVIDDKLVIRFVG